MRNMGIIVTNYFARAIRYLNFQITVFINLRHKRYNMQVGLLQKKKTLIATHLGNKW